jgi:outer membrane protein
MKLTRMLCLVIVCVGLAARAQDAQAPQQTQSASASTAPKAVEPDASEAAIESAPGMGEIRQTHVLTMDETIRLALQHNLDIQISRYTPLSDQYKLFGTYSAYEPTFVGQVDHSFNSTPGGFNSSSGLPQPSHVASTDFYQPEVKGELPTGLTYDLTGPLNGTSGSEINGKQWDSNPGITLSQPVLQNLWIDRTRLSIQLSKNTLKTDELGLRLQIMKSITQIKTAYFNLIAARANVMVNVEALTLAEQLVTENQKRVQVGALAPLDEKQSESQAASSRANLLAAEQNLSLAENTLKNLITEQFSEWAEVTPIPSEALVAVPAELNLQESWRRGITQRPELLQSGLAVTNANLNIKYDFNQLFPNVTVNGSYGRNASDPTISQNFNDISTDKDGFYSYGVTVTIPLGNTGPRNAYKSDKALREQARLQFKQLEQTIIIAIDNDIKTIRSDLQQVDATREARIYAKAALEAEQTKLQHGASTSFIVLQLQSNLTTARSAEIAALANYNIAIEQLALDEGSTLERNRIDLQIK